MPKKAKSAAAKVREICTQYENEFMHKHTSQKTFFWGDDGIVPKFCDICPIHHFLVLYEYEKKICFRF